MRIFGDITFGRIAMSHFWIKRLYQVTKSFSIYTHLPVLSLKWPKKCQWCIGVLLFLIIFPSFSYFLLLKFFLRNICHFYFHVISQESSTDVWYSHWSRSDQSTYSSRLGEKNVISILEAIVVGHWFIKVFFIHRHWFQMNFLSTLGNLFETSNTCTEDFWYAWWNHWQDI